MSARPTTEEVLSRVCDDEFGLADGDSSDDDSEGIYSYLGKSRTDPEEFISMGRRVMNDRSVSGGSALVPSEPEDYWESTSDEEGLYRELGSIYSSSLPVYCEFQKLF